MAKDYGLKRRTFLKTTAVGTVGLGLIGSGKMEAGAGFQEKGALKIREYRSYGKTGFKVSDIALGGVTNIPVIQAMLDAGVNYIDTAESYSRGQSEIAMGKAIKGRDRKKLFINTKLHIKENETKDEIINRFEACLKRLDTPYIDSLMTHNPRTLAMVTYEPFHQACSQLKKEKKLRFTGISSHGPRHGSGDTMDSILLKAVEDGRYDVVLVVYNFIQKKIGERIIDACKAKDIGVTLMKTNPIGRYMSLKQRIEVMEKDPNANKGRLDRMKRYMENLKGSVKDGDWFLKKHNLSKPSEVRVASTKYALSYPGSHSLLARTDSFEDMEQFLKASGTPITNSEKKTLAAYKHGFGKIYCRHACGICESACPKNVPINTIMRYNHYFESQKNEKLAIQKYMGLHGATGESCMDCQGSCQVSCPYGVPIQGLLTLAHRNLTISEESV